MQIVERSFSKRAEYDVLIASCGYERRSSYLARLGVHALNGYAVEHPGRHDGSYFANSLVYRDIGWPIVDLSTALEAAGRQLASGSRRIAIDISSMPRRQMAQLALAIEQWSRLMTCEIDVLYCPADFSGSADAASRDHALSAGPVSDEFVGAIRPPSIPIAAILGLGLEQHRAVGVLELLEPARVWAFVGASNDARFADEALRVNEALLAASADVSVVSYDVASLARTYAHLESLCFGLDLDYRIVFAPSGPKIFSLACLLVALTSRAETRPAVWRVGSDGQTDGVDVEESGYVYQSTVMSTPSSAE